MIHACGNVGTFADIVVWMMSQYTVSVANGDGILILEVYDDGIHQK